MEIGEIEKPVLRAVRELDENNGVPVPEIVSYIMSNYADHREKVKSAVTRIVKRILRKSRDKGLITSTRGYYRLRTKIKKARPGFIAGACPVCGKRRTNKRASKRGGKGTRSRRARSSRSYSRK